MTLQDLLIEAQPVTAESESNRRFIEMLIEAERARVMQSLTIDVAIGSATGEIVVTEISGMEWSAISHYALRPGNTEDVRLGCNTEALLTSYPVDRIAIDGDNPTPDEWRQLCELIGGSTRSDIVAALWWLHIGRPQQDLAVALSLEGGHRG